MASRLVMVTGGCRSGKSGFAQRLVEQSARGSKTYIATCPVLDREMADRIERHRRDRAGLDWITVEEQTDLACAIAAQSGPVLVDCLTLWIGNLFCQAEQAGVRLAEDAVATRALETVTACRRRDGLTVVVTNEVGLGIVPGNPVARAFRDSAGRANQIFAAAADEVHLLVSGISLRIK